MPQDVYEYDGWEEAQKLKLRSQSATLKKRAGQNTKNISLPESLIDSAMEHAEEGEFDNASDYVRSLIRTDVHQREEEKLERMLLEGVRSGRGIEGGRLQGVERVYLPT
jgi:antitoxin ParD1/3/4